MQIVDRVEMLPTAEPIPPSGIRRAGSPAIQTSQTLEVDLNLAATEDAVLLLEQDGVYGWHLPESTTPLEAPPAAGPVRRGPRATPEPGKRVRFRIYIRAERTPTPSTRRNIITDFLYDKVKVYAIKFAAKLVIGHAVKYLERNVRTGLVRMDGLDPSAWGPVTGTQLKLPKDRPARILLFVHGTFSSTIGSFGHLCGTPWGQAFLSAVETQYDAIIGFDHQTLSEDPVENASHLLRELETLACPVPPQLDTIAFSRGGLVLRSLIEHLLPFSSFQGRIRKAVFVGCTNGGTKLASSENWHTLLDLYTNIAAGAFRLLSWLPQVQAPAVILKELVQSVGAFVKHLATNATTDVPGLAAMRPDGEFVRTLNETQLKKTGPADTLYYAITSEFRPEILGGDHKPKELPLRLVMALADGFIDRVMNAPNDLVVDTESMSAIDLHTGGFIKDMLAFGTTPMVYHTTYFTRPEVVNACTRWLELQAPALDEEPSEPMGSVTRSGRVIRGARKRQLTRLRVPAPLPGRRLEAVIAPASVDTDIVVTSAGSIAGEVYDLVRETNPSFVVVARPYEGRTLHYAFRAEELMNRVTVEGMRASVLNDALNLHETDSSQPQPLGRASMPAPRYAPETTARRAVVISDGRAVGVVPEPEAAPGQSDIVELAKTAVNPTSPADLITMRRAMPTFASRTAAEVPTTAAPPVTCHLLAEMDSQVLVNHVTTVQVSISREMLAPITGRATAAGTGQVEPDRKIIVQVIPKLNFALAGESDREEIDVPRPSNCTRTRRPIHPGGAL